MQADSRDVAGGIAKAAVDAVDGMIDDITKTAIIFYWRLNLIKGITKKQCLTNSKSKYVQGGYLTPLNQKISRHVGFLAT